jgi:hypothetical protein
MLSGAWQAPGHRPNQGAAHDERVPVTARQSHRLTAGGKAVSTWLMLIAALRSPPLRGFRWSFPLTQQARKLGFPNLGFVDRSDRT